jgi:hypothetical protein
MKPTPANLNTEAIFARCRAHFCRVTGLTSGDYADAGEKHAGFQVFYGCDGFFSRWHGRC